MAACEHSGCRAHAMRGERWCRSHHPGLPRAGGAPAGNRNAVTHGLYARFFDAEERQALSDVAGLDGLTGEIAVLRVAIARLLAEQEGDPADRLAVLARGVDALGRALRHQHVLSGDRAGGLMDALEQVLGELGVGGE